MVKRDFFFFFCISLHDIEVYASVIEDVMDMNSLSLTSDKLIIFTIPFLVTLDDF